MTTPRKPFRGEPLSEPERVVMGLVVQGYAEKKIAAKLGREPNTIYTHTYRARAKLGATTLAQAAVKFVLNSTPPPHDSASDSEPKIS